METSEKRKTPSSSKQQVLVEFKVNRKAAEKDNPLLLATKLMDSLKIKFDKSYAPKTIRPTDKQKAAMVKSSQDNIHCILRASVDKAQEKKLRESQDIVEIWPDFQVFPTACPDEAVAIGRWGDVVSKLETSRLASTWERGTHTFVGVVDGGINVLHSTDVNEAIEENTVLQNFGYRPGMSAHLSPGMYSVWNNHGSMMARDIQKVAPHCDIVDIRIANDDGQAPISNVIDAYTWAIEFNRELNLPFILVNGWSVYDPNLEPGYLNHPIHRKISEVIENGLIILCPAGNCGSSCPDNRCSVGNDRPGSSIWGISGNHEVITVGAADSNGEYLPYSSEGPATRIVLGEWGFEHPESRREVLKPDFCSVSHFPGYRNCDSGTSAATATAAGVVAILLRGTYPVPTHREIKQALIRSASNMGRWDYRTGYGMINAERAYALLERGI